MQNMTITLASGSNLAVKIDGDESWPTHLLGRTFAYRLRYHANHYTGHFDLLHAPITKPPRQHLRPPPSTHASRVRAGTARCSF